MFLTDFQQVKEFHMCRMRIIFKFQKKKMLKTQKRSENYIIKLPLFTSFLHN